MSFVFTQTEGAVFRHSDLCANAFLAAATAMSISDLSASATSQIFSPLVGSYVPNFFPDAESTHSLFIKSCVYFGFGRTIGLGRFSIVFVFLRSIFSKIKFGVIKEFRNVFTRVQIFNANNIMEITNK